jgi:hypothetical protein
LGERILVDSRGKAVAMQVPITQYKDVVCNAYNIIAQIRLRDFVKDLDKPIPDDLDQDKYRTHTMEQIREISRSTTKYFKLACEYYSR